MRHSLVLLVSLSLSTGAAGQELPLWKKMQCSPGNTLLNAALWVQNSAEYKANARQVYANAQSSLDRAIADKSWSATGQTGAENLPAAVILDLDETALNNIRFEARAIRAGITFSTPLWEEWSGSGEATEIPGARAFLEHAVKNGVTPFYITNRKGPKNDTDIAGKREAEGTLKNLVSLRFPLFDTIVDTPGNTTDNLLLRNERKEWEPRDKAPRRDWVAQRYRVLLLVGDDLNDFVTAANKSESDRDALVTKHGENWGTRWFILPNPMYGSWHDALLTRRAAGSETMETPKDGCHEIAWKIDATNP
jgi:acid phosphatase